MTSGWSWASSSAAVTVARGLRSSWEASPTNRRWAWWPACSRASIAFKVTASRVISSLGRGTGSRSARSAVVMSSTRARIRSTGRSDRPTRTYVATPTMTTITGSPKANSDATVPSVSVIEALPTATTAVCIPSGPATPWALTRNSAAASGTSTGLRCAR